MRGGSKAVDSVVVGAGPAGIAVLGRLLGRDVSARARHLWVDPVFGAGRIHARYRRVPSNTRARLFVDFAAAAAALRRIVDDAPAGPNAWTTLRRLPQDRGCALARAADLCLMLSDGLRRRRDVWCHQGRAVAARLDEASNLWTVELDAGESVVTRRLILCTGSSPAEPLWPLLSALCPAIAGIHLDAALNPPLLSGALDPGAQATVAVVGASHSAVLVLMNLYQLASTTHPNLRVKWFTRHQSLAYAEYMDGWILRDNTGLKGEAAEWARRHLDERVFASSPVSKVLTKLYAPAAEEEAAYRAEMPGCTHVVQAVGFRRDPLPLLTAAGDQQPLALEHDGLTGRFFRAGDVDRARYVPGLFGAGIAFPERVTDPRGNEEHAVGLWKFTRFCKRVVPSWVNSTRGTEAGR